MRISVRAPRAVVTRLCEVTGQLTCAALASSPTSPADADLALRQRNAADARRRIGQRQRRKDGARQQGHGLEKASSHFELQKYTDEARRTITTRRRENGTHRLQTVANSSARAAQPGVRLTKNSAAPTSTSTPPKKRFCFLTARGVAEITLHRRRQPGVAVHDDGVDGDHGDAQDGQLRQQRRLLRDELGSTATMKMMPFGLVALVRKPVSTRRPNDGWAAARRRRARPVRRARATG